MTSSPRAGASAWVIASVLGVVWLLAARISGPSDLWHQTQPKTIAYTTDIIVHGRWILPLYDGREPATKPPFYNWLAVPAVKWLGFDSELAHKLPSVAALAGTWLTVLGAGVVIGRVSLGGMAGLMLVASFPMFKLGYLARPDMLLTLWLTLGWAGVTVLLLTGPGLRRTARLATQAGLWTCVGLAALTKGPPALVVPLYGLLAARVLTGRWGGVARLGLGWLPLAVLPLGAWLFAVGQANPTHLVEQLWGAEILGRVTGTGEKGPGPLALLIGAPSFVFYFVVRFVPWSIGAILGMVDVWRRRRTLEPPERALLGAAIFVVVVVVFFSLSAGKRADYIAGAYGPAALLAAAWWIRMTRERPRARAAIVIGAAAVVCAALTIDNRRDGYAPVPGFGDGIVDFARRAGDAVRAEPLPIAFCWTETAPVRPLMGASQPRGIETVDALIAAGEPFWVVAGRRNREPTDFADWVARRRRGTAATVVLRSIEGPHGRGWPRQLSLYRVVPSRP